MPIRGVLQNSSLHWLNRSQNFDYRIALTFLFYIQTCGRWHGLTLKAPITTAADNKFCNIFLNFQKNKVWFFLRIVCQQTILVKYQALFVIFESGKIWNCHLLQIKGGTLWVKKDLGPPVKYFTGRSGAVLLLWIFCVFVLSCVCCVFVRVCLIVLCGRLLGGGWPIGSRLWCLTVDLSLSNWCPGSGVVLDCIDSWSLHPYLLSFQVHLLAMLPPPLNGWMFFGEMERKYKTQN